MDKEHRHLPLLVVQLPQGTMFFLSSRLDSAAVKYNSPAERLCKGSGLKRLNIEVFIQSEVVGVAKVANNYNDLVKGSSTRQKLQNSKEYTEAPEFSPALELIIFGKKSLATN